MALTLVLCKPSAVERGLVGEIVGRLERKGLRLVAAELRLIDREIAGALYGEHEGCAFYAPLMAAITRGPILAIAVEGPEDAQEVVRTLMGTTDPAKALPGTMRGDLALHLPDNLVHGSDSPASAARELAIFFPALS